MLNKEIQVKWESLSEEEKKQVEETYVAIRESEEERSRNETSKEYLFPIDKTLAKECGLFKDIETGYIFVDV